MHLQFFILVEYVGRIVILHMLILEIYSGSSHGNHRRFFQGYKLFSWESYSSWTNAGVSSSARHHTGWGSGSWWIGNESAWRNRIYSHIYCKIEFQNASGAPEPWNCSPYLPLQRIIFKISEAFGKSANVQSTISHTFDVTVKIGVGKLHLFLV